MNLDPKLLSVRLECIAETIRTRPVLGHWPAMQAHIDAQAVLQARDEIERLQREVTRLSALVRCGEAWMDRELDRRPDSIDEKRS